MLSSNLKQAVAWYLHLVDLSDNHFTHKPQTSLGEMIMKTLVIRDLKESKNLNLREMASIHGGIGNLMTNHEPETHHRPGTQADIDRLSTSLFGGPLFPGLAPEFP